MSDLLMIDIAGTALTDEDCEWLRHPMIGGVILFTRNFSDMQQLRRLTQAIQACRSDLVIAVDHEGGYVQRFQRSGFSAIPAASVYGKVYDLEPAAGVALARQYGAIMASELLACGVDLSLAPVLDLDSDNAIIGQLDRAFHASPDVVTELAEAFIAGMRQAGMPAVGKHFPGHASCHGDSHLSMPVCDKSLQVLEQTDLKPFINLIARGQLAGVMPAYVIYPEVDDAPAGFSKIWLDLLRDYGFDGLIVSDCLSMKGADVGALATRAHHALAAGCDLLIVCNQSRAELKTLITSLADHVNMAPTRLQALRQQMKRFNQPEQFQQDSEMFFKQKASAPLTQQKPSAFDYLNTTQKV